jgi:hypothetical protein
MSSRERLELAWVEILGALRVDPAECPLADGKWYVARSAGDGLGVAVPPGSVGEQSWIAFDALLDGSCAATFSLLLREQQDDPAFEVRFGLLNQCSARIRVPLSLADANAWLHGRQAGWLKPCCYGRRVDPRKVSRLELRICRKGEAAVRWCQTPVRIRDGEPPRLADPLLPAGPLLDEMGQSTIHTWKGRTPSIDELASRLRKQLEDSASRRWPDTFSRYGGWKDRQFESTGFFRAHHDGRRWWLVDPEGFAFWSAGPDCVRPSVQTPVEGLEKALTWLPAEAGEFAEARAEHPRRRGPCVDFLAANLIRAFGAERYRSRWAEIVLGELRRLAFNTFGNWSQWQVARDAGFPYVRSLLVSFRHTPMVFRDFPDVFAPQFGRDAAACTAQLVDTADDPALVGYFLMNEPSWGFASETPAEGMLRGTARCETRRRLAEHLRRRYRTDEALRSAWGMRTSLDEVREGRWDKGVTTGARNDLVEFSAIMVDELFRVLTEACRRADPNHMNLGARYYTIPPDWALEAMRRFDVFSINCYEDRPPAGALGQVSQRLGRPVLIGEWHFGALDAGLPASGIGHVRNQEARGQAYRAYLEAAAAAPCIVGAHYFQLYDQSALGRHDGENYNIGFLDVCNRPYGPLAAAARAAHERLYPIAAGQAQPTTDAPEYLPRLFY